MSLRPPVDQARIEAFLDALAQRVRVPVRLYLQGGSITVAEGARDFTIDIDYDAEVADRDVEGWTRALREVAERLQVNVELAGPGDFIPLPDGWRDRCRFLSQRGTIAVYSFDAYSTALSKLARGSRTDLEDVRHLLATGRVQAARLRQMAAEVARRWNERTAHQAAATFLAKVDGFLEALQARPH